MSEVKRPEFSPCPTHGDTCQHLYKSHPEGRMYDCPGCESRCHCEYEGPENVFTEDDAAEACVYCGSNADLTHTEVYGPDLDQYDTDVYGVPESDTWEDMRLE